MTTKRPPSAFFTMTEGELQSIARAIHGRPLRPAELRAAIRYFEKSMDWVAENAIEGAIEECSKMP